eukprot:272520_1
MAELTSFINSSQATRLASLKSLQKFVLSLNKQELQHLINTYLKSKLLSKNNANGTLPKSNGQILNDNNNNNQVQYQNANKIDEQILSKMNIMYQNKCKSKIISKMQQININNNNNLLSIPPELLSYCFQYLSYSESCRLSTVCLCFVYIKTKYNGLSNYYIKLNKAFFHKVTTNKINLSNLIQFKHIEINYGCHCFTGYNNLTFKMSKNTKLFRYILHRIINQSKNNLNALTINVTKHYSYCWPIRPASAQPFNVLLHIMNNFKTLPINKLILLRDMFEFCKGSDKTKDILNNIQSKIANSFPQLTHFECRYPQWSITTHEANKYIVLPIINQFGCNLRELKLHINTNVLQLLIQNKM